MACVGTTHSLARGARSVRQAPRSPFSASSELSCPPSPPTASFHIPSPSTTLARLWPWPIPASIAVHCYLSTVPTPLRPTGSLQVAILARASSKNIPSRSTACEGISRHRTVTRIDSSAPTRVDLGPGVVRWLPPPLPHSPSCLRPPRRPRRANRLRRSTNANSAVAHSAGANIAAATRGRVSVT